MHCNGCNTTFKTHSSVEEITVEICSNCHPFYTGKQKLVDVAGRVDRFRAKQDAAKSHKGKKTEKVAVAATAKADTGGIDRLVELKKELDAKAHPAASGEK